MGRWREGWRLLLLAVVAWAILGLGLFALPERAALAASSGVAAFGLFVAAGARWWRRRGPTSAPQAMRGGGAP